MSPEIERYLGLLELRLSLLRALAQQLTDCRKDFIAMDLDGMHCRIAAQQDLCRQIKSCDPAIDSLRRTCPQQLNHGSSDATRRPEDVAWAEKLREAMREMDEAQGEVARLNRIHAAFLRRSCRTIRVLMNFMGNYALTYARHEGPVFPAMRIAERG